MYSYYHYTTTRKVEKRHTTATSCMCKIIKQSDFTIILHDKIKSVFSLLYCLPLCNRQCSLLYVFIGRMLTTSMWVKDKFTVHNCTSIFNILLALGNMLIWQTIWKLRQGLPHQVKMQYLLFRFHANYFLLP